jgi:cytochrome c-type biogenesis protein
VSALLLSLPPASLADWFSGTARDGSLLLAVPVALVAGTVSFFSPCVIPLLPGYLSYVTGLSGADIVAGGGAKVRGRMLAGVGLFVLGFALVYVALGGAFGALGDRLIEYQDVLTKVLGVVTILLGLVFAGVVPWFQRDVRVHTVPAVGVGAAPVLGVLFGLGWTPCIGPTLGAVLSLSGTYGANPTRGAILAFVYCLGLGIPFLIAALSFERMMTAVTWVRKRQVWVMRLGGAMLVVVGILLLTGVWDSMVQSLQSWLTGFETPV